MYLHVLVREFCQYATYIRGFSKHTERRYTRVIGYFSKHAGIEKVEEVTEAHVRALFFHGRMDRQWSSATYISVHCTLSVFFKWCIEKQYLTTDFTNAIEIPKLEKRLPPKLTKQESMRLLEVIDNYPHFHRFLRYRNHAMFSMFVFAGLRRGELLHLKYADVDIDNLSIFIRQGKGSKDRIVPMSTTLAHTLTRYVEERKRLKKTCPEFFTSLHRNMGYTEHGIKRLVLEMRAASGIRFTIHQLRHTFATLMLEGGCDIYSLSKMMGHADIKTTTIYLAASAEHLRNQMTKHPLNNA